MKVEISYSGNLKIVAENDTELFALKKWTEDSINYSDDENIIKVLMGTFEISNNYIEDSNGLDFIEHIMEMKL